MGFRVIIVGGSVAGLSVANMLEQFGIDYVLLEAYTQIAPKSVLASTSCQTAFASSTNLDVLN
ncbi:FAD-binding domain [Fusarium oxysporum f. sp. vasinfectum]|nr:FAD-binding domain [Fusarium oxysporum f. sp. vasinfectum]